MYPSVPLLSASRQNLRLLTLIRTLVLAAQTGAVGLAFASQLVILPWFHLGATLVVSAALCLGTALRLRGPWPVTDLEYAVHLGCDLLIHSALLYYSGGSTNPFVSYYLVPLTIAAATLPWLYSIVLSGLALAGYTLMLVWYDPIIVPPVERTTLLVYGMWLSFALAAALITFFVTRMAEQLRHQEQFQAQRREESMRDQQLLAVATQAAGAAHELGTPLATMSVLLKELRQEHRDPQLDEDLALLQSQVQLCKESLTQLVRAAEADRRQAVVEQTVREWVDSVMQRWHLMHPEATFQFHCLGKGSAPKLMPPADLSQSLLNLLNNATDACPDDLDIRLDWNEQWIKVTIRDHGAGVPLAIAEQIGRPFITTKGKGFGLGLFLSQASVTRAGGTVKLYNHEDGGALTELRLPHGSVRA
ncbi:ATP-binding protein [Stutzerimonas nitrititolerans]|uniref:histidine kinase n=1 Tax=Stutzerimonas nitrititolerans TaxID=2482751 RepID=A0AA42BD06_9GAMM|nr:ATP-binding protein [Stutzerimonas nitrititolerans]AFN76812.1 two-component sensor [Stutzerimonas stutzeri DSM 10701]KRW60278.1 histidine kinase [Pseudomonas sp. TTU2014-066ASC]MBA1236673.1 HAMP domain-containing histidine kinase [Stutzerimonas stutzeri]RRV25558.1 sensor histidine kinase [Pseudomonas sp. s199]WAD28376.1 ATP-binding protein [Pseudomonadaceae bacterium T75]HAQ27235.1 sensor histidine kinase [Pseudomonas sp.]